MQSYQQHPEFFRRLSISLRPSFLSSASQDLVPVFRSHPQFPLASSPNSLCPGTPSSCNSPTFPLVSLSASLSRTVGTRSGRTHLPSSRLVDFVSAHPPVPLSSHLSSAFAIRGGRRSSPEPPCSPSAQPQWKRPSFPLALLAGALQQHRSPARSIRVPLSAGVALSLLAAAPCAFLAPRLGCLGPPLSILLRLLPGL